MFKSSSKLHRRASEAAIAVLASKSAGDMVTHEEMAAATGLEPNTATYNRIVLRARERNRDAGRPWSHSVPGEGYRLLTRREQLTDEQARRYRRARNQIARGRKAVESIPDEGLTEIDRRIRDAHRADQAQQIKMLDERRRASEASSDRPPSRLIHPNAVHDGKPFRIIDDAKSSEAG